MPVNPARISAISVWPPTLLFAAAVLFTAPSEAQVERSGASPANTQLYQEYQEAQTERTQLQSDNAKLKSDLADTQKQLAVARLQISSARSAASGAQAALAAAKSAQSDAEKNLAALRAQAQELIGRFRDTIAQLRSVETDRTQLRQQLADSRAAYIGCVRDNDSLYQIDDKVLDLYAHQGMFSRISRAEPFTRLTRTRLDNIALENRQRANALHLSTASPTTSQQAVPAAQDH
jgi:septal ring factor EnvC (AmiA/AmiB activator)